MLDNFHLTAIVKKNGITCLRHIPLRQDLQESLAISWDQQYHDFLHDVEEIPFNPGYTPEGHERFVLHNYQLPQWLAEEDSLTAPTLDAIVSDNDMLTAIAGISGFARDNQGREVILLQNFSRSHVIKPGSFLFLDTNTYTTPTNPGMSLDEKLTAIFLPSENRLLFKNFRNANTFLPLSDFYRDASEQEIREVLEHPLLSPEDPNVLAVDANQWFRKRFAMLRDSEVLDRYTASEIADHAQDYEVDVQVIEDRIVFPAERAAAKRLLQFLNEERFRGAITDTLYETNSKRAAN